MKITIDTKEDSTTDIRKVIALLSKLIEDSSEHHSNIFEDSSPGLDMAEPSTSEPAEPATSNAFANMFGNNNAMDDGTPVLEPTAKEEEAEDSEEESAQIMEY